MSVFKNFIEKKLSESSNNKCNLHFKIENAHERFIKPSVNVKLINGVPPTQRLDSQSSKLLDKALWATK